MARNTRNYPHLLVFLLCVSLVPRLIWPVAAAAQVRPVYDQGALGLGRLLKRINTTASVMMIGAHPDDEDSALLAYLARRENADTAYLSLTRGDGGQNIIGPELFESLGVIRTEELLQARRLDGAQQFFTRAFDYGFSKTLAEAKQKWDEKVILCDTVRAIRLFRPLVVISRFSGTPADGHGQHQYAGYISPLAVIAAADPTQCNRSGSAWQVQKFYVGQGFGDNAKPPTLRLNTGEYDPMLGRSYFEIAMEGRSQHKSQGEGRLELHGDLYSGLNLHPISLAKPESDKGVFDGIDITISGIAKSTSGYEPVLSGKLAELQTTITSLTAKYRPFGPKEILPDLVSALAVAREARSSTQQPRTKAVLSELETKLLSAIFNAAGIQIDALAGKETVAPGEDLPVTVNVYVGDDDGISIKDIRLNAPAGWLAAKAEAPKENVQGFNRREVADRAEYFTVKVAATAEPTQPYWLEQPRDGDLFRWPDGNEQNLPVEPAAVSAQVKVDINGTEIDFDQPLQYRYADAARGEIRRDLNSVPKIAVDISPKLLVIPQNAKMQTRQVKLRITNNFSTPAAGKAELILPKGWKAKQEFGAFKTNKKGENISFIVDIEIPANTKAGSYDIAAAATIGGERFSQAMTAIAYPHIQTHRFYTKAETDVRVLDLKVSPVSVGYIMGSGDEVPDAVRQMGLDVAMLNEKDLSSGDLSKFGSIVVGIRASETRPDFVANFQRLLEYMKNGGNLIVQYQRPSPSLQTIMPFPAQVGPRVSDENAAVNILQSENPILSTPNRITNADFEGWVQERNSYNFSTFDEKYTPLLESHDPGEAENKGGLVVTEIGKGKYIYCSYSLFRQLPAGVPGAYRLFANLLSAGQKP